MKAIILIRTDHIEQHCRCRKLRRREGGNRGTNSFDRYHEAANGRPTGVGCSFRVYGFPAILLAHKLKLFPLLANRSRSLPQVCEALGIKRRPVEAILAAAV